MNVEKHPTHNRDAWLELRRQAVNASEVAALFGMHPYQTEFELYADKANLARRQLDDATLNSGRLLEPVAAERVRQEHPEWQVRTAGEWLFAPALKMGATPDFYVSCPERGNGVLQVKTVDPWAFKDNWTETLPPQWIILQTLQEMFLSELNWGIIAAMEVSRELPLHIYEFDLNQKATQKLIKRVKEFWTDVAAGKAPPVDYTRDESIIKAMYARDNGVTVDLTGNNRLPELLSEREHLKAELKTAQANDKALRTVETEIKAILGEAKGATLPGWSISSPTISRKGYVVEPTTYRTLRIKRVAVMENAA